MIVAMFKKYCTNKLLVKSIISTIYSMLGQNLFLSIDISARFPFFNYDNFINIVHEYLEQVYKCIITCYKHQQCKELTPTP